MSDVDALVERLRAAFAAHPILKGQKKLVVVAGQGVARVQGLVFTRDMVRQVEETVEQVAGDQPVRVAIDSEVRPPRARPVHGRVPEISPGGVNMDPTYSVRHLADEDEASDAS